VGGEGKEGESKNTKEETKGRLKASKRSYLREMRRRGGRQREKNLGSQNGEGMPPDRVGRLDPVD